MVNRKWAYRELFDSEEEAARAYDGAVWRLKPKEAKSYVNFKERPGQASTMLGSLSVLRPSQSFLLFPCTSRFDLRLITSWSWFEIAPAMSW